MSGATQTRRQFGDGPLSRITSRVYILLVVELLLLLTTLPALLPLLLLDRDPSNLPLAALLLVPVGPAISAALYALRHQRPDLTDLRPATLFWRGYRANVLGVLRVWVPTLLWLTVLAVNLAYRDAVGLSSWWAVPLVLIAVGVTLCAANALVITSLFDFRTRDVLRLAVHFLAAYPRCLRRQRPAAGRGGRDHRGLLRSGADAARVDRGAGVPAHQRPDDPPDPEGVHRMSLPLSAKVPFGGDYNPEQWPEDVWKQDYRLFDSARIDLVTLGVFDWALTQPAEDTYDFALLDRIVERASAEGRGICLATGTGAHPPWLAKAYPEVTRTDFEGRKHRVRSATQLLPQLAGLPPALDGAGPPGRPSLRRHPGGARLARRQRVRRRLLLRAVRGRLPELAAPPLRHPRRAERGLVHHLLVAHLHATGTRSSHRRR